MTVAARLPRRKKADTPEPGDLLGWYDRHARVLPWRARGGEQADPYRVWLSEIMLQQTTVKAVAPYYARFLSRWPTVGALAAASLDDVLRVWAGLGYYARARNLHACAKVVVERHGGQFPNDVDALRALPGIGDYTAAAVAAIAFDLPAVPVDGNVERVVSRLFAVEYELPAAKPAIKQLAASLLPARRAGDFAQALMDLGATICSPKRPACALCPWSDSCLASERGDQETFPRKAPKREGKLRRGAAFVVLRSDGRVLLRRRPDKGLLAAMMEVPGSDWTHDFDITNALRSAPRLAQAKWQRLLGAVRHVFTHFPLELAVFVTQVPRATAAPRGARWVKLGDLPDEALPNVMRKVLTHALETESPAKRNAMTIQRHDTGPRMSKVVVHGNTVYLAGIVADNPKGKTVTEQTKDILKQIDGFLAKAGTDKTKLLSANIWITDMANFADMNAVWDAWVSPGNTPARATVEAKLAAPDYKVEIMVVAAK